MDPFEKWMEEMAREMAKEIVFPGNSLGLRNEHLKELTLDCFNEEDEESSGLPSGRIKE